MESTQTKISSEFFTKTHTHTILSLSLSLSLSLTHTHKNTYTNSILSLPFSLTCSHTHTHTHTHTPPLQRSLPTEARSPRTGPALFPGLMKWKFCSGERLCLAPSEWYYSPTSKYKNSIENTWLR